MIITIHARGGRYKKLDINIKDKKLQWWYRDPINLHSIIQGKGLIGNSKFSKIDTEDTFENLEGIDLHIEAYARPYGNENQQLITVCLINRSTKSKFDAESVIFQSEFSVKLSSESTACKVLPYPGPDYSNLDEEEQALELLYRSEKTYAVGHGCASDWAVNQNGDVTEISAVNFPFIEVPSTTPDIQDKNGRPIEISMAVLAGLIDGKDGFDELYRLVKAYNEWISDKKQEVQQLEPHFRPTAEKHLEICKKCSKRIDEGIRYLKDNPEILRAFQLANRAMLLQQLRSTRNPRKAFFNKTQGKLFYEESISTIDFSDIPEGKGKWRAFQIAFILMTLKSTSEGSDPERDTVELIWFPTGGGKTEAYLGLSAFSMLLRRLRNPQDAGTDIIMRYTMRLLTTQQFQRASTLICALEYIRRKHPSELGSKKFSIGLWVGRDSTPNTREAAISILRDLTTSRKESVNKLILDKCPWCGAQMGPIKYEKGTPSNAPKVIGYSHEGNTVVFRCPDTNCDFNRGIPVYIIDEDIYDEKPTLIIGTVDKFALIAWNPEIRFLFGIGNNGRREISPPNLIIQDELHLISGPLGSMVGLYESIVEELCTDRRLDTPAGPKIISSTATIRRYENQIKSLYARDRAYLFPPPGIEISDSFFSRYAVESSGRQKPGRIYVGIHAPAFGSMQTAEVRTISSLLQAPMLFPKDERDPWWTLMVFFNSLRELGPALSLLQSDIPDYQKSLVSRLNKSEQNFRFFWHIQELTGRLSGEMIPEVISELEVTLDNENDKPVDVCLASNILEVGIDIDRLSLMIIVGQPISTSRYIQVTGRVGRSWWERPGLIATIYSPMKSRDRSHFEKFKTYHQRLYAQVEPSSVTPFSPPALERGLHSLMAAYVRQFGEINEVKTPYPFPEKLLDDFREILVKRINTVNSIEIDYFNRLFTRRMNEWKSWQNTKWSQDFQDDNPPLLYFAGQYVPPEHENVSWRIQLSLRNVDAECREEIILPYFLLGGE